MTNPSNTEALPANRGRQWVTDGILILRGQFLRLLVLGLVLQLLGGFMQSSVLGLVFILCLPVFTAGMLQAMHLAANGQRPPFKTLFAGFSMTGRLGPLLLLGALILGLALVAMAWALAGALPHLDVTILERMEAGDTNALLEIDPWVIQRIVIGLAIGLFAGAAISYFAAPLVWFTGSGLGRAIIDGLRALARQWRPFLVLGLILALVGAPVMALTSISFSMIALGDEPNFLLSLFTLVFAVAYQMLLFSTQYAAFKDIFGFPGKLPMDQAGDKDDQLIA